MPEVPTIKLQQPRLQDRRALLVAGFQEHYTPETMNTIPALWKRLPFGRIPGQLGHMAYGIVYNWTRNRRGSTTSAASRSPRFRRRTLTSRAIRCQPRNTRSSAIANTFRNSATRLTPSSALGCRRQARPTRARRPPLPTWLNTTAKTSTPNPAPATWKSGSPSSRKRQDSRQFCLRRWESRTYGRRRPRSFRGVRRLKTLSFKVAT